MAAVAGEYRPTDPDRLAQLTKRELLAEIANDRPNDEIAGRLFFSPAAARTYVSRPLTRLDAQTVLNSSTSPAKAGLVHPGGSPSRWHGFGITSLAGRKDAHRRDRTPA